MNIAFDAKRAYQNGTGLGHYSRTLISSLAANFPNNKYYLCAPKITNRYKIETFPNIHNITPTSFFAKRFKSVWRSSWVKEDLKKACINLYHGLSHEIPIGIQGTGIKTVVTIHDLIFERYPKQYKRIDMQIYRKKFKYACENANEIIAISQQTKEDIIQFYKIPAEKISVCYQSCNAAFAIQVSENEKERIRKLYNLPHQFFLYVGSIIERKNLLSICKAINEVREKIKIPLVVIGDGDNYKHQVKAYIKENKLEDNIIFLSETHAAQNPAFTNATDFPAIYQLSTCIIYPSIFEGFGLPVLEALWSKIPVITSNISCLPETGGNAAYYVNPYNPSEIAAGLIKITNNKNLAAEMVEKGWQHAQKFTPQKCAEEVMQVYLRLL